jgi:hypothetical protein
VTAEEPREEAAPAEAPLTLERPSWRRLRRFLPLFIAAGVAAIGWVLLPHVPHDREIELKIKDPATIVGVEMGWSASSEAVHGGTWRYEAGKAPAAIFSHVSLPDGRYEVDVEVHRQGAPDDTWKRSVDLEKVEHLTLRVP